MVKKTSKPGSKPAQPKTTGQTGLPDAVEKSPQGKPPGLPKAVSPTMTPTDRDSQPAAVAEPAGASAPKSAKPVAQKKARALDSKPKPAIKAPTASSLVQAEKKTPAQAPVAPTNAQTDASVKPVATPAQPAPPPMPTPPAVNTKATEVGAAKPQAKLSASTETPTPEAIKDSVPVSKTTASATPSTQSVANLKKVEAEFVASHSPLPTPEAEDEAYKLELLRAVEAQYPVVEPADAREPDSVWDGQPMTEAEVEVVEAPSAEHAQPATPSLFIVQITPELAPVAKVGGLADVVFGLANEMEIRGNHVEIILPKYDCLRYDHIWGFCETYRDLMVPWFSGAIHCTVYFGFVHGRKCFFIEPHSADNFFNRGCIYGFNDDVMRFAFFTRAAMEFMWKSGKHPDIIHCHDWQTALAPVFLYEIYQHLGMTHPRACFTIHNFKHQGVTGAQLLNATGLNRPDYYFQYERLRDNHNPHAVNLMKAGVVYSNFVTTVSPRHAVEAKDQGQGFGLEPTLHIHHGKYGGVINGIDYAFWNPEIDPLIAEPYSADNIDAKYANKRALRGRLMLADNEKPIVAFVGRLDPQKGLELIRHAIFNTLQRGGQFVLLGSSPDGQINNYFWSLKHQLNDNPDCHIEIGFNEELSHLIYAGSDMMLVPSRFEPCGLTQLIAMRYGSIPVVREVGGLVDTVFDKDHSYKPLHERNGYVFRDYDEAGLESALGRAIDCYYQYPEHFRDLIVNAMRTDYSWKSPGQDYLNIYNHIRDK